MNIGELWVAHPAFPWIVIILAFWVGCSTILMVRIWGKIRKLENSQSLQTTERTKKVAKTIHKSKGIKYRTKRSGKLRSGESRVRIKEQKPAAIEETNEDEYDVAVSENKNTERASIGSA